MPQLPVAPASNVLKLDGNVDVGVLVGVTEGVCVFV